MSAFLPGTLGRRVLRYFAVGDGCWTWTGHRATSGYGRIRDGAPPYRQVQAHRVVYELLIGPVPEGMDLDHLCRNRACVNPSHLEPVSRRENLLRGETIPATNAAKAECQHGHRFDEGNTYTWRGARLCRRCRADSQRRLKQRRRLTPQEV